jgi:hypothetical protein
MNVLATYPLYMSTLCTVLNPVHARDPLHEPYPLPDDKLPTRLLRTHAPATQNRNLPPVAVSGHIALYLWSSSEHF